MAAATWRHANSANWFKKVTAKEGPKQTVQKVERAKKSDKVQKWLTKPAKSVKMIGVPLLVCFFGHSPVAI